MASTVKFKFKSARQYDVVSFPGTGIKVCMFPFFLYGTAVVFSMQRAYVAHVYVVVDAHVVEGAPLLSRSRQCPRPRDRCGMPFLPGKGWSFPSVKVVEASVQRCGGRA